jgi:hypothetical protein
MSGFLKTTGAASVCGCTTGSTADGYVVFFVSTTQISGDNDFFWDRGNNNLRLGGATLLQFGGTVERNPN